jgi:hypothetical protein
VPDRFYVALSATCDEQSLPTVLERMQAAQSDLSAAELLLDGLSLSFTREDGDEMLPDARSVEVPLAGPVTSTGPGTPPPDTVGQHADPEQQQ